MDRMDAESRLSSHNSRSADDADVDSSSVHRSGQIEAQCMICRSAFYLETEMTSDFEAIHLCRECRSTVLDGNETSVTVDLHRRRRQRGRSRHMSSESIEDLFSQQFSHLISLVRHEAEVDGDAAITEQRGARYNASPGRISRWQRTFSDNESDGLYQTDSLFGESDSNISFDGYGEYAASLDGLSLLGREMLIPLDDESHTYTDTDIDPMHAGLDQWNSDEEEEEEEEDGDWGETEIDERVGSVEPHQQVQDVNHSPIGSGEGEALGREWIRWRLGGSRRVHYADIYASLDELEIAPPSVGNPGDYVDAIGFELADIGSLRRGAPRAATSIAVKLPNVVISEAHETNGGLVCAVCKDPLAVNTEAKQLPCLHLYHPSCILPWLRVRNTCPVCRYELRMDDVEYEEKRRMNMGESHENPPQDRTGESSSNLASDSATDEVPESSNGRVGQGVAEGLDPREDSSGREGGARRWVLLAAAPIVSIVGMALVFWFRNSVGGTGMQCNTRELNHHQLQRPRSPSASADQSRRWSLI